MPMDMPAIPDSARGVSNALSSPNSSIRPSVTRKTPPSLPTSSPRTITLSSFCISWRRAIFRACTIVILAMVFLLGHFGQLTFELLFLCFQVRRHFRIGVFKHVKGITVLLHQLFRALHGLLNFLLD